MVRISSGWILSLGGLSLSFAIGALSQEPSPSPPADTELICLTDNAADCYPRVFSPTKDFQTIKEGQDIPPGLHVRMNIYTGEKEARLNIPLEGEEESVAGIPVEEALVVVPQPEDENVEQEMQALRDQVPQQPPVYEAAGKVEPPKDHENGGDEFGTFQKAMITIQMEARAFDSALDDLSELSHDIYYGVEIVKNGPLLEKLVCVLTGQGSERIPANAAKRDHKAAIILGNAVRNNPTALSEVGKFSRLVMYPSCGGEVLASKSHSKHNFITSIRGKLGREKEPATLKGKVGAISGILREPYFRQGFLANDGMELLLSIFLKKGEQYDGVRHSVAKLVMDNFLDEGMGAELGIWPKDPVSADEVCEVKGRMLEDGCWEHHVEKFAKESGDLQWVHEFLDLLRGQRPKLGSTIKHGEL